MSGPEHIYFGGRHVHSITGGTICFVLGEQRTRGRSLGFIAGWSYVTLKKRHTEQTDHEWQFLQRAKAVPSLGFINTSASPLPVALGGRPSQSLGHPSSVKSPCIKLDVLAMSSVPNNFPPQKKPLRTRMLFKKKKGTYQNPFEEKKTTHGNLSGTAEGRDRMIYCR